MNEMTGRRKRLLPFAAPAGRPPRDGAGVRTDYRASKFATAHGIIIRSAPPRASQGIEMMKEYPAPQRPAAPAAAA
jgi:hypothetical protein